MEGHTNLKQATPSKAQPSPERKMTPPDKDLWAAEVLVKTSGTWDEMTNTNYSLWSVAETTIIVSTHSVLLAFLMDIFISFNQISLFLPSLFPIIFI